MTFAEDDSSGNVVYDIQSGDTITVSWPTSSDATNEGFYLKGYANTVDLTFTPEGSSTAVTVGQAVITTDGVTITFNSNVENYQHVEGYAKFQAQAYNTGTVSYDTTDTIVVSSGDQSISITVTRPSGSSTDPDTGFHLIGKNARYYHNDSSTGIAEWGISLNSAYSADLTGTVTVTDTLSDKLDAPEFVRAYVHYKDDTGTNRIFVTYDSESEFENALDATFSYNSSTGVLTIALPASSLTSFSYGGSTYTIWPEVYFNTAWNSNASSGDTIENTAYASYYTSETQTEPTSDSATTRIAVSTSDAGVSGVPYGTLQITKVVDGTTVPIEGVTFRVYQLTGDGGDHVSGWYENADGTTSDHVDITTDSDGLAKLTGLSDGFYEIEEAADLIGLSAPLKRSRSN